MLKPGLVIISAMIPTKIQERTLRERLRNGSLTRSSAPVALAGSSNFCRSRLNLFEVIEANGAIRNIAPRATLGQPKPHPVIWEVRCPPDASKTKAQMPPIAVSLGAGLTHV